jgi:tetratricopeptide (TPR) repeat protein
MFRMKSVGLLPRRAGRQEKGSRPVMDRPRLFLSAVSQELRTARNAVAATVRTLGYDPVSQDDFPTGCGELRDWLRREIDSCEGLLQIVGHGYGMEPRDVEPAWGRVSYTQFEFLYARQQGKKTWLIIAGENCQRDRPPAELDLPDDPAHPDPKGYQAERRRLQQDYLARLQRENHLWHQAENPTELQNVVLRLRDELIHLRWRAELRHRRLNRAIAAILLVLAVLGGGTWWGYRLLRGTIEESRKEVQQTRDEVKAARQAAEASAGRIHAHLLETADRTHRRELAEAEKDKDWKRRQRLREAANAAHKARLERIEELAASFGEIEARGEATSVFQEMTRVLAEQGVDEAIAYVESQRPDILKAVAARSTAAHQANRAQLQPLLKAAALQATKGQSVAARNLYLEVLAVEPDWPNALDECFWFLIAQGDAARIRSTQDEARRDYEEAHRLARRLTTADPGNTVWQHDLSVSHERLANVAMAQGKLNDAARHYGDQLAIATKLAAADPGNTDWQRDLAISCEKLGDVAVAQGKLDAAERNYGDALAIAQRLARGDSRNAQWQRDLSVAYNRLGDVAVMQGKLADAARCYGDSLAIAKQLAAGDSPDAEQQRDLSISYDKLGDVAMAQGKLEAAARHYGDELAIAAKLAAADPGNANLQWSLFASYSKLGNLAAAQHKPEDAMPHFGNGLAIAKKLVAADPSNSRWQRDLSVSYDNLGNVAMAEGKLEDAARYYGDGLVIAKQLAAGDPGNAQWQQDLAIAFNKLGVVAMLQQRLKDAAQYYGESLAIAKNLAASNPDNAAWQQHLAICYNKLGDLAAARGKLEAAARSYGDSLAIRKKLAAADPTNAKWQRQLCLTYWNLAELAERRKQNHEAREYWQQAFAVLAGIERRGVDFSAEDRRVLAELRRKAAAGEAQGTPAEGKH